MIQTILPLGKGSQVLFDKVYSIFRKFKNALFDIKSQNICSWIFKSRSAIPNLSRIYHISRTRAIDGLNRRYGGPRPSS